MTEVADSYGTHTALPSIDAHRFRDADDHSRSARRPGSQGSFGGLQRPLSRDSQLGGDSTGAAGADKSDKGADKGDINLLYGAVEARWILMVLDDSSAKLSLLSHLTPDILQDRVMDQLDAESYAVLRDHFTVEKQWLQLVQGEGFDPENKDTAKLYEDLEDCLSDSVRSVARILKSNTALVQRLKELAAKRTAGTLEFINTFARLRKVLFNTLKMTAEEERAMREELAVLRRREEADNASLQKLSEHLSRKRAEHRRLIEEKDQKILRLKSQIEELKRRTENERVEFERQMRDDAEMDARVFKQREAKLQKDLADGQAQFETDGADNFRRELANHRKQRGLAEELEKQLGKYDKDMTDKHEAIVDLTQVYKDETAERKRLDGYFDGVDTENRRIETELRDLQNRRNAELDEQRRAHHAALLVQKLYKDHQSALAAEAARQIRAAKREAAEAKKAGITVAQLDRLKRLGLWNPPQQKKKKK